MAVLRVIDPGLFTTVQDRGRSGYTALGVPPSGAFDATALVIGNRLLGNAETEAALECTLQGPTVTPDRDAWICLTGADAPEACIAGVGGDRRIAWCEPVRVARGERVKIGPLEGAARAYLCISGGLAVPEVLGSRSTYTTGGLGGHHGRALRRDDAVPLGDGVRPPVAVPPELQGWLRAQVDRSTIRIVSSLSADQFPSASAAQFTSGPFRVLEQSSRIGVRLTGPAVALPEAGASLDSEPTVTGGIQIAGDGQPIILGCDRPTTGGYPMFACVIEADLGAVAALRPRDWVRFQWITLADARRLAAEQQSRLDALLPTWTRPRET